MPSLLPSDPASVWKLLSSSEPIHGGFLYYEVLEILQGLTKRGDVVGIDLVEVAPAYDPSESTQILAAQILLNLIGFIFHNKS